MVAIAPGTSRTRRQRRYAHPEQAHPRMQGAATAPICVDLTRDLSGRVLW
jgi:hypothetical protein